MNQANATLRAVAYLHNIQEPDGSFVSYSSPKAINFEQAIMYRTTFVPALMLGALSSVPPAQSMCATLAPWVVRQKSINWSFNYWAKTAPERKTMPYPNDLDDTACALIGLWLHNPKLVTGKALGNIVKLLLATETSIGGPYRTWLVPPDSPGVWLDVDLATNSNIAYLLRLAAKPLPSLTALMEQAITTSTYTSPYYPSVYPIVYYIARAYDGPRKEQLARYILTLSRGGHWGTPLNTALALSALKALGNKSKQHTATRYLLDTQQPDGSWRAEAYCRDPSQNGQTYYHGAPALTTAFVLEALQPLKTSEPTPTAPKTNTAADRLYSHIFAAAEHDFSALTRALQAEGTYLLSRMRKLENSSEITLLPFLFAKSLDTPPGNLREQFFVHLGLANLYGWMAYTIYDDFLDNEGDPVQLSVANTALRYSLINFHTALPDNAAYQTLVHKTFNTIDGANAWEVAHARFAVNEGRLAVGRLPSYATLQRLAERSLGHTLTPLGVLAAIGTPLAGPEAKALQTALKHYLIARQLNDDAHDWPDDIRAGRISYVVVEILRGLHVKAGEHSLDTLVPAMQRQFWHHTLNDICGVITNHTIAGREAAAHSNVLQPVNFLTGLYDAIDEMVAHTLEEQKKTKEFLTVYGKKA